MSKTNEQNSLLRDRLKDKLQKQNLSVHALEKAAGLKRSAVDNILRGKSKKPSADILSSISRILNCSVDSLLGNAENTDILGRTQGMSPDQKQILFNTQMYADAVSVASEVFFQKKPDVTETTALQFIQEVYTYSLQAGLDHIDRKFACWLAEKWLDYTS
jgi:transcriptional regulator with XRE-family HTH domain